MSGRVRRGAVGGSGCRGSHPTDHDSTSFPVQQQEDPTDEVIATPSFSLDDPGELCLVGKELLEIQGSSASPAVVTSVLISSAAEEESSSRPRKRRKSKAGGPSTLTFTAVTKGRSGQQHQGSNIKGTKKEAEEEEEEEEKTSTPIMKAKKSSGNGEIEDQQMSGVGGRTPTPGTPSDQGTPNPPTPGNGTNSSGMVNSPHQYVTTITVDDQMVEGGVGVGGAPSYSVYNVGEGATIYTPGSTQYYTSNSSTPYSQDGGVYMVPASGCGSGGGEMDGNHSITHATRVSPTTTLRCTSENSLHPHHRLTGCPPNLRKRSLSSTGLDLTHLDHGLSLSSSCSRDSEEDELDPETDQNYYSGTDFFRVRAYLEESSPSTTKGGNGIKICPLAVQWLLDNYETAEGVSLPRCTLYNHYLRHCSESKLDPVNAASFGKLIRSVFLGLRTRRLGTRGNSKYHYYGIRVKPSSPLSALPDDFFIPVPNNNNNNIHSLGGKNGPSAPKRPKQGKGEGAEGTANGFSVHENAPLQVQQYLGETVGVLDDFPELDLDLELPPGLEDNDLHLFSTLYREHCETLLESLGNFQLGQVEGIWKQFWRGGGLESDLEKTLAKEKLVLLCGLKAVEEFVKEVDFMFYQKLVGILLPDVLRPIPSTMTQAIRNFAKALENWLTTAMSGYPESMVRLRASIVACLSQTLRRYTSLNHLAQAARAVLQNQTQITQMLSDLNRVDFHNVQEQASWVCGCDGEIVPILEQDFKSTLGQHQSLEQWAAWLEGVVDRVLKPHLNSPNYVKVARQFLLKWSFYSSLIIRDLTLRSAASFGSFHLLRLLYDEYMFYLVEHRVAQVTGVAPIAVIGKKIYSDSNGLDSSNGLNGHPSPKTSPPSSPSPTGTETQTQVIITTASANNNGPTFGPNTTVKSDFRKGKHFLAS